MAISQNKEQEVQIPVLRDDIQIFKASDDLDGSPCWTLFDAACNRFFKIGWLEFEVLSRFQNHENAENLANAVSSQTSLNVSNADILQIIDFLVMNELVKPLHAGSADQMGFKVKAQRSSILQRILHGYLFFMIPLFRPENFLKNTLPFVKPILSKPFFFGALLLLAYGIGLTFNRADEFFNTFLYFFTWQGILLFVLTMVGVKVIHELSHAYMATQFGVRVSSMGVAFMVLYPVMYTETTGAWRVTEKKKRLLIGAAGVMAEIVLAAIALLLWHVLGDGPVRSAAFLIATVSLLGSLFINLNPFMRFDGYYLLSDALGVDNLQNRSFELGKWYLRKFLFGWKDDKPEVFKSEMERGLIFYAYTTWLYRFFLFIGIALLIYNLFFQPLGLFLMVVEIWWFILLPIWNEIKVWLKNWKKMRISFPILRTACLFLLCVGLVITPWRNHIEIPAVMLASEYTNLFAAAPARIKAIHVSIDDFVQKENTLVSLESPDLDHQIAQTQRQLLKLEMRRKQVERSAELIAQKSTLDEKIIETKTKRDNLLEQKAKLTLTADFDGKITSKLPYLHEGQWISRDSPIIQIVNMNAFEIQGYFQESALNLIKEGHKGRFYPNSGLHEPIDVVVSAIEKTNVEELEWPELSSLYGGSIATLSGEEKRLKPKDALFKIYLKPEQNQEIEHSEFRLNGFVKLETDNTSLFNSWLKDIQSLLVKEINF